MGRLIWLEVKASGRRPGWIFLAALWAWIFAGGLIGVPTLDRVSLGPARVPFSVGEWGRALLLALETVAGVIGALFVGLFATSSFAAELRHREALWHTKNGTTLQTIHARVVAITSVATFVLIFSSGFTAVNPYVRQTIVQAGWKYIPVYLVLAWFRIAVWVAFAAFLFHLTRSRWGTTLLVGALQSGWFLIVSLGGESESFARLFHANLVAWNFVNPFLPLGAIPAAFLMQGLIVVGVVLTLSGATLLVRKNLPEWQGVRNLTAKAAVIAGAILVVGAGIGIVLSLNSRVAPFTASELWEGEAMLDRPYIWSKDLRLLVLPSPYAAIRLPPSSSLPAWAQELAKGGELRRYSNVGEMPLGVPSEDRLILAHQDLILIHPAANPYPSELNGAVQHFHDETQILVERARFWEAKTNVVIAWPEEAFSEGVFALPQGLLVSVGFLQTPRRGLWAYAWSLTAYSKLDELVRCYLGLYLMTSVDEAEVKNTLTLLQDEAEGRSLRELRTQLEQEGTLVTMVCPFSPFREGLCEHVWMKPEAAKKVLEHWHQGEEMGHENYIRLLLEGQGD